MYTPDHFREDDPGILHEFLRANPFATVVTLTPGGLVASHIPMILDSGAGTFGTLRGHIARANSQWRDSAHDTQALAIFHGPQHYISPSWYEAKQATGRVVPTWNYIAVHAYGSLRTFDDPERLRALLNDLTRKHEAGMTQPWSISDAPENYIAGQLRAIVGVEIEIVRLEGKWKLSQNRDAADRKRVVEALSELGTPEAEEVAKRMRNR